MLMMFEPTLIPKDNDGERTCGCCFKPKPIDQFYKDGTDSEGNPKFRRDCKECYRITRLSSRRAKSAPAAKPLPGRRKK
jgi:hypothetical protein